LIEPKKDKRLYAGSACTGEEVQSRIPKNVKNRIHEKGYRGRPLTERQERNSREKSKIRVCAEHVFGHMANSMGGLFIRTIGNVRAHIQTALINTAYNLYRYTYLQRIRAEA
jgi:IS5 family transposase